MGASFCRAFACIAEAALVLQVQLSDGTESLREIIGQDMSFYDCMNYACKMMHTIVIMVIIIIVRDE